MIDVGRLCVKTTGKDSGKSCVVVEVVDDNFVVVDGQLKRKRCNVDHLEPSHHQLPVAAGSSHEEVVEALKVVGIDVAVPEKRVKKPKTGKTKSSR
ncbi:50S ribosomal protein L14e [Candidatus Woesearchaeota archaeon]|nr:50S ribosomal protein L14e [Candidatus Woesearchaeota archaeon]